MKRICGISLLLIAIQIMTTAQTHVQLVEEKINAVKDEFAPDKRTAIFNIQAEEQTGTVILTGETNLPDAKQKLLKELLGLSTKDEINVLPGDSLGEKTYGIVTISVANLRTKPEHAAELATQALLGMVVKVYKKSYDDWYLIQTPDSYISWVDGDGIQRVTQEEAESWKKADKIIYTQSFGTAYESADDKKGVVSDLVFGALLRLTGETNGFYSVSFPDGRNAFVKKTEADNFLHWMSERKLSADNVHSTAKKFLGIPYLWGGTSVKGLDCSGFTKTVFFANGVILPRDASQQVFVGEKVDTENDFSQLKPGDLLFFGTRATSTKKERITHVAIYLGDYEFIHASGRVRINSLNKNRSNFSKHRLTTFIRAKRLITSLNQNGVQAIDLNNYYK